MANSKWQMVIAAWFIFSLSGQSAVEEAKIVSARPYESKEQCVATARLLQGLSLAPFYYCVGSAQISELPPPREQSLKLSIDGDIQRR